MTNNENENLNSSNEKFNVDEIDSIEDIAVLKEKFKAVVPKYNETLDANRQLFERTKKAEGFEKNDEGKWVKQEVEPKEKPKAKPKQTDELDYAQLAFHNSKSNSLKIESEADMEFLKQQMQETGKSQKSILDSKWFQTELSERREAKTAEGAIPKATVRAGAVSRNEVDFWMKKGELPPDTLDNRQLRRDIVNARYQREKSGNQFSENPIVEGS